MNSTPDESKPKPKRERDERQDWLIVLLILLIGFCCVIVAGQWALRLSPNWKLDTNMESNLDLNSEFLTSKPIGFFEPVDPAIMTRPAWANVLLTPGVPLAFTTGTPLVSAGNTLAPTTTTALTPTPVGTGTITTPVTVSPTNTFVYIPPAATWTSKPNPGATATNTSPPSTPSADLQITKTSATGTYAAGATLTYTVTVVNNGPSAVTGTTIVDMLPAQVLNWDWACTSQTGGANGCNAVANSTVNFIDTVNLPNGASIVYTVTARTSPAATTNLTNTASINVPGGYNDSVAGNNQSSYTHTLTVVPLNANLQITKTSVTNTYAAGNTVTYTVTVSNIGTNAVTGAVVSDTISAAPSQVLNWDWACTAQNGGANGCNGVLNSTVNFSDTVNLPVGASIVYTVTARTSPAATANLTNTASVNVPAGYTETAPADNQSSYTHTFTVVPLNADLGITKTSATNTYAPGSTVTYTVTVINNGPNAVTGATIADTIPAAPSQVLNWDWVCTAQNGGATGCDPVTNSPVNFSDTVNLPVGASIVYTVTARTSPAATANLTNTASVNVPAGYTDTNAGNNQSSYTHTFALPSADLRITKTSATGTYAAGDTITYTVTVENLSGSTVTGATIADTIPAAPSQVLNWDWACTAQNGGANGCDVVTNSPLSFNDVVNLPVGSSIVYTVTARTSPGATANLTNTASVNVPGGYTETDPSNNQSSYTHTFTVVPLNVDLRITKTSATGTYSAGDTVTYTVTVENIGANAVTGAVVSDNIPVAPSQVISWDWACLSQTGGANGCDNAGNSTLNFSDPVNLPVGATIVYTVTARTSPGATANLTNTASVSVPVGYTETDPSNNQSSYTHTFVVVPTNADLGVTKGDGETIYPSNGTLTYTIRVTNHGPSAVTGVTVTETLTGPVSGTPSWTCTGAACPAGSGSGLINHTLGNLTNGAFVQYQVTVNTGMSLLANLVNTASVTLPGGYTDPGAWPNSATDTDVPEMGTGPDCVSPSDLTCTYSLPEGSSIQLYLGGLQTNGSSTPDLVYYERPSFPTRIRMDWVIIRVSPDGSSWTTVLNWGDYLPDTNTNIFSFTPEDDELQIPRSALYPSGGTGITIDLDALGLSGSYPYIEIYSPLGGNDPQIYIDGIGLYP